MGGAVKKAAKVVQPVLSALIFYGKGFNPYVALGIFAIDGYSVDHKNLKFLILELMI